MNRLGYALLAGILILIALIAGAWYLWFRAPADGPPSGTLIPPAEETLLDTGKYYRIEAAYPASTPLAASAGAEADTAAAAMMEAFVRAEAETFKRESGLETLTPEDIELQNLGGDRVYTLSIQYELHESDEAVSYVYLIYADTMGAHPNAYYRTFAFDKATGTARNIGDLFAPGTGYLATLSELSRRELPVIIARKSGMAVENVGIDYIESGTEPVAENFQWFYLTDETLTLIFPPYQVGPWAIGTQEVPIPRAELAALLRPEYR